MPRTFQIYDANTGAPVAPSVLETGDVTVSLAGGAFANTNNLPTPIAGSTIFPIDFLTAAENVAGAVVRFRDQTTPAAWGEFKIDVVESESAEQIAAAVWDEPRSTHTTAGTYGEHSGDASTRGTRDLIESLRPSHTGQTQGEIFYVSPNLGDTHANGARGGPDDPYSSLQDCHDNAVVSRRHDVIILVADNTSGITILDEQVTISKDYLSIRGPGRDFDVAYSSNGDTLTITGDGVSLEKIQVNTHTAGNGRGIVVEDQDFVRICNVWVNNTRGDGVSLTNCTNFIVEHCTFQDTGQSGAGEGLRVEADPGSASSFGRIRHNYIDNVQGDGIFLDPTGSGEIVGTVIEDNRILECTSAGIRISGANVRDTVIAANNQFAGNATDVVDSGTDTTREMFFDPANDTVANVTLVATTTTNTDMRGTDGANTTAPATPADVAASETTVIARGDTAWVTGSSSGGLTPEEADQLARIDAATSGATINVVSRVAGDGTATVIRGTDASPTIGTQLTFSRSGYVAGAFAAGASGVFRYKQGGQDAVSAGTVAISQVDTSVTAVVTLTDAETNAMEAHLSTTYEVEITSSGALIDILSDGTLLVKEVA